MIRQTIVKSPHMSRSVSSSQHELHPRLMGLVEAHLGHAWLAPLHAPSVVAFEALQAQIGGDWPPLVLDSGCGTGASTLAIARAHPDCLVIGVDKSHARLARTGATEYPHRDGNVVWLRAELATFWRLARQAGWKFRRHYLLYPNPWPKPGQLQRRWHAHPVFPELLRLGGRLELRCNWEIYALEFAAAVNRVLGAHVIPQPVTDSAITTPFEHKYRASGHPLYSVVVSCDGGAV
jgi:tRNA (guanine-N7-)-methyltransferase